MLQRTDGFQFDQNQGLGDKVGPELAQTNTVKDNFNRHLFLKS